MNSRDWSAIGGDAALPRWIRWAIPPLLIPLSGIACLAIEWDHIPLRYGNPPMSRTPLHVFGFLLFAEGLTALLVGLMVAIWHGSRRPPALSRMQKVPLAMAYLLSTMFTLTGLTLVTRIPAWPIAAAVPIFVIATIVYLGKSQSDAGVEPDRTPDECWSGAGIYRNPKDTSLMVRARVGYGYTFNMANPWSYRILIGLFGGIVLLVGFLIWALH